MYVHMPIHIYVHTYVHMYMRMFASTVAALHVCVCACVYCMCVMFKCVHCLCYVCVCVHVGMCMYMCSLCMYVTVCICVHEWACTYVHMRACTWSLRTVSYIPTGAVSYARQSTTVLEWVALLTSLLYTARLFLSEIVAICPVDHTEIYIVMCIIKKQKTRLPYNHHGGQLPCNLGDQSTKQFTM